jgi:hypothetical protein
MLIVESVGLLNEADDALTIAFSGCSGLTHQGRAPRDAQSQGSYRDGHVIDERERDATGRAPAPWISC